MKRDIRFAGLDVHAETIAVAVAEPDGQVRSLGIIPIRPQAVAKEIKGHAIAARESREWEPVGP